MKKYFNVILLIVFSISTLLSFGGGIRFEKGDWNSTLKKARKEKKLIFVYCNYSKSKIEKGNNLSPLLKDKKLGEYFNENFICYKLNTYNEKEKKFLDSINVFPKLSELGINVEDSTEIAKLYPPRGIMMFAFIDTNNVIVHRVISCPAKPKDFIELVGKKALNPETRHLNLFNQYKSGDRSAEFLKRYAEEMRSLSMFLPSILMKQYFKIVKEDALVSNENYKLIKYYCNLEDVPFHYFLNNKDKFLQFDTKEHMDTIIFNKCYSYIMQNVRKRSLEEIENKIKGIEVIQKEQLLLFVKVQYYHMHRMEKEFHEKVVEYFDKYNDVERMDYFAGVIFMSTDDLTLLRKATEWKKKVMDRHAKTNPGYYNSDSYSYAEFLYKTGDNLETAKDLVRKHIKTSKKLGYKDQSSSYELIRKIKAKIKEQK